jgi:hypothetical protein
MRLRDSFWSHVRKGPGCWLWTRGTYGRGYGELQDHSGAIIGAHRFAWRLQHGSLPPPPLYVLHRCDVKLCVRPSHLYAGTPAENVRDAVSRGRQAVTIPWAQAQAIRSAYAAGGASLRALAHEHGISKSVVHRIVRWQDRIHAPEQP